MTDKPAMTIDKSEAAAALAAADQSLNRSSVLHVYRLNAPMVMMWGVIWIVADLSLIYLPREWRPSNWVWPFLGFLGGVLSGVYYWFARSTHNRAASRAYYFRMLATWLLTMAFIFCAIAIFSPFKWREPHAFFGVLFGAIYAINGIWTGLRISAVGFFMMIASMWAFYSLPNRDYLLFMGLAVGGSMVLGGFWLRKV